MPSKKETDVVYRLAVSLVPHVKTEFLELGRALQELREADIDRFMDVHKHQPISKRMTQFLADVARVFGPLNIHDARLKNIGVTKLIEIYPVINKNNAEDWLKFAELHTVANLKRLVKNQEPLDNARSVNLKLSPDEYDLYRTTVSRYGGIKTFEGKGKGMVRQEEGLINALRKLAELEGKTPKP